MTAFNSKGGHEKLATAEQVLQNTCDFVISRCCFTEEGKKMCQDSKRTCRTIVLLNLQGRVVRKPVNVNPGLNVN